MRDSGRRAIEMVTEELATYGVQPTFSRKRNRPVASFTLGGKQIQVSIPDGSVDVRAANNTRAHVRRLCRAHGLFPQGKPDPQPDVPTVLPNGKLEGLDRLASNDPLSIPQPSNDPAPLPIPQPANNTVDAADNPVQAEVIPADGAMLYVPRGPIIVLTASDDIIITKGEQLIIDVTGGRLLQLPPDKLEYLYKQQGITTLRDTLQSLSSLPQSAPASQPPPFQNKSDDPAKAEQPDLIEPYPASIEQPLLLPDTVAEPPHELLGPSPPPPEATEPAAALPLAQEPEEEEVEPEAPRVAAGMVSHRGRHSLYGVGAQMGRVIVLMRQFHLRDRQSGRRQDRVTTADLRTNLSTKDVASLSTVMSKGQSAGLICKLGLASKNGGSLHYFKLSPQGFFLANKLGDWPFEVVNEALPRIFDKQREIG